MQEETSPNSNNILSPSSPSEKRNNENSLPQNNIPPLEAKSSLLSLDNGQNNNENSMFNIKTFGILNNFYRTLSTEHTLYEEKPIYNFRNFK